MAIPSRPKLNDETPIIESKLEIMTGWKDIANYLGMGVRTVQRYEREHGLPVRRPAGKTTGSVIATKAELDGWVIASPIRDAFQVSNPALDSAAVLNEFRRNLKEMRRLRQESAELREELHGAALLQANLSCSLPQQDQTPESSLVRRASADVLPFDFMKKKIKSPT